MGLGTGIFLMAVGAVLAWGVNADSTGSFDIDTIGMILFVIGIVATLLSLAFWSSWGGAGFRRSTTTTYDENAPVGGRHYHEAGVGPRRTTVHEERRDSGF